MSVTLSTFHLERSPSTKLFVLINATTTNSRKKKEKEEKKKKKKKRRQKKVSFYVEAIKKFKN
jgi:hypothetical protein